MFTDSNTNASIPMAASNSRPKKKANRSAKLKQCKLVARREQFLSQGNKSKGCKERSMHACDETEKTKSMENLEIKPRGEREEGSMMIHLYSDTDSPSNSPTSNLSGNNFTGSSGTSRSSSCSGSIVGDNEVGEDWCLDDWETIADALAATDNKQEQNNPSLELPASPAELTSGTAESKPKVEREQMGSQNFRAWNPDDTFRPRILPNLSKQRSFPMNSGSARGCCKKVVSPPSSCPICCEDLDFTDSSFLPCSCGFRLCLFCHKRIVEQDGRCPGCRKQYDYEPVMGEATVDGGTLTFRLARSCSMITRS